MCKLITSFKFVAALALAFVATEARALDHEPAPHRLLEAKVVSLSDLEAAAATNPTIDTLVNFVKVTDPVLKSRALAALESANLESTLLEVFSNSNSSTTVTTTAVPAQNATDPRLCFIVRGEK